ncbi:MAG: hypothetical protein R3C49_15735 [Planctomycetaceae bacterium]
MTQTSIFVRITSSILLLLASHAGVAAAMDDGSENATSGLAPQPAAPPLPVSTLVPIPVAAPAAAPAPIPAPAAVAPSNDFPLNEYQQLTPSAPGTAPIQNGVAGKVPDSFTSEPQHTEIRSLSNEYGQTEGSEQSSSQTATADRVAVFTQACHFPLTGPGRYGQRIVRDALVIYEGMQLAIQSNGKYELRFVAEVPRTAAVVRLQFQVSGDDGTPLATITIPPVTIDPDRNLGRHNPGHSVVVSHRGYSHGLNRAIRQRVLSDANRKNVNNHDLNVSVSRSGVVRFGSVPEKGEYSILPVEDVTPNAQP